MADILTYNIQYTINGIEKISKAYPICTDFVLSKDSSEYKNIISTSSKFTFYDSKAEGISDYTKIKDCEDFDIYTRINLIVFKSNQWLFTMYFSPVDCSFDDDRCTCEVTPQFDDDYRCLFDTWEKEHNILKVDPNNILEPVQYQIDNPADLELFTCTNSYTIYTGCPDTGNPLIAYYGGGDVNLTVDMVGNYGPQYNGLFFDVWSGILGGTPTSNYDTHPEYIYKQVFASAQFHNSTLFPYYNINPAFLNWVMSKWRIYKNKFTIIGNVTDNYWTVTVETTWCCETLFKANNPDGTNTPPTPGYTQFKADYVAGIGGIWYGREPFYVQYIAEETANPGNGNWIYSYFQDISSCNEFEFNLKNPKTWGLADTLPIYRGRELMETFNFLLKKENCNLFASSQFFLGYDTNPITQELNPKYILNKCYDIKHPLVTDTPATELFISFKNLLETICEMFNCQWYIYYASTLDLNILKIEHLHYFENNFTYQDIPLPSYDLTSKNEIQTGQKEIIATNKYSYNVQEMYNTESWAFSQYYEYDFAKLNIDYDLKLNNGLKRNEKVLNIVTDLAGIITSPGSFDDNAIVLVACRNNANNVPTTITEKGYRTKKSVTNGWCCLSNIFNRFYRHGRVLLTGELDAGIQEDSEGTPFVEEFKTTKDNKLQTITVRDCNGEMFFDSKGIKTFLGEGRILNAEYNLRKDTTKFEILI